MKLLNVLKLSPCLVLAGMLAGDFAWAAAMPESEYSLDGITPVLAQYRVPTETLGTSGSWTRVYAHYSLHNLKASDGTMTMTHTPGVVSGLNVDFRMMIEGGRRQHRETMDLCFEWSGKLSIPKTWEMKSSVMEDGKALDGLSAKSSGALRDNTLVMKTVNGTHKYTAAEPATINWLLFDAVSRFGGKPIEPLRFTLIDHGDKVKPEVSLSYRKSVTTVIGNVEMTLQSYEMKGQGILPTVFWTDERGLLLFVISGREAYCLKEIK